MENTFSSLKYSKDDVNVPWSVFLGSRLPHGLLLLHDKVFPNWVVIYYV